jgi:hypothetical protein
MLWPLPNTAKRVMTSPLLTIALTKDSHSALHLITTALQQTWKKNSVLRFAASGVCGNAVFYGLDKLILPLIVRASDGFIGSSSSSSTTTLSFMSKRGTIAVSLVKWLRANAESVSFFVSYLLDIFVQHFLNALLVFGMDMINTRELYLSSLATSYTAYFGTLCGSTILQAYLLQWGVAKNVAFWGTIATGSLVNFIVLTSLAARSKSASSEKEHPVKTKR